MLEKRASTKKIVRLYRPNFKTNSKIPIKLNGSGDLVGLSLADGMLVLPQDKSVFIEGENYRLIHF